jgi:hypothetical protein
LFTLRHVDNIILLLLLSNGIVQVGQTTFFLFSF